MGTRSTLHVKMYRFGKGKDLWLGCHWDGYGLAQTAVEEIETALEAARERFGDDDELRMSTASKAVEKACWRAAADHTIDFAATTGLADYLDTYDDFSEYCVEVTCDRANKRLIVASQPMGGTFSTNVGTVDPISKDAEGFGELENAVEGDYELAARGHTGERQEFETAEYVVGDTDAEILVATINAPWLSDLPDSDDPKMTTA